MKTKHVLNAIRDTRSGQMYVPKFGERMRGTGVYADLIKQRFDNACKSLGLNERRYDLRTDMFRPPPRKGEQMSLFS